MSDTILLDTNILVCAYDNTEGKKHEIAQALLEDCFLGGDFAVSFQNLTEFFAVVTRKIKKPISPDQAKEILKTIIDFTDFKVILPQEHTLIHAVELSKKGPFWDALIAATMLESSVHTIYTENTRDFKHLGVTAVNPFKR